MPGVIIFYGELLLHFCSSSRSEGAGAWKLSGLLSPSVNARRRHSLYFQSAVNFPSWTSRVRVRSPAPVPCQSSPGYLPCAWSAFPEDRGFSECGSRPAGSIRRGESHIRSVLGGTPRISRAGRSRPQVGFGRDASVRARNPAARLSFSASQVRYEPSPRRSGAQHPPRNRAQVERADVSGNAQRFITRIAGRRHADFSRGLPGQFPSENRLPIRQPRGSARFAESTSSHRGRAATHRARPMSGRTFSWRWSFETVRRWDPSDPPRVSKNSGRVYDPARRPGARLRGKRQA